MHVLRNRKLDVALPCVIPTLGRQRRGNKEFQVSLQLHTKSKAIRELTLKIQEQGEEGGWLGR